ncbi:MAG TPA: immunoglobulin domain-containing protein [Verrucomicrobiae bacterium]|jgi:hypothetical protein
MFLRKVITMSSVLVLGATLSGFGAEPGRVSLSGHVPTAVTHLIPIGTLQATNTLDLAIGLPLRNKTGLNELIRQLYDPSSTHYHQFLSPAEFTARFGPTEQDYEAVQQFVESNHLVVVGTHPNRLVLEVTGSVPDIERAFQITLRTYHHPTEARDFFAPDTEPAVPADLPVVDVEGLTDYSPPRPMAHLVSRSLARPLDFDGSGPGGEYAGPDFRNAYAPGSTLTGTGQAVGLLELSTYFQVDVTNYEKIIGGIIGKTNFIPLTNVLVSTRSPGSSDNIEVALDIEMCVAMAPGLSRVIVYEENLGRTATPATILSRMASDDLAKQLSSSWTWGGGPTGTVDNALMEMSAQGQSFFQAAGDSDAYTGANELDNAGLAVSPVDSTNVIAVGGTTLTMNGKAWASETVWNYNTTGIPNEGSGGGTSSYYTIPWWQAGVSMADNQGSTTFRNLPDVALTADNIFACYDNGTDDGSEYLMGTSCAAPLWAAFTALINQQSAASGHSSVGFLNPALYAIGAGTNYAACFHDITTGSNIGTNTPGFYNATNGYDLCTGWGTPTGTNLINELAPYPYIATQPATQVGTNGNNVSFIVVAGGQPAFSYRWLFNGTNLPAGGNVSGNSSSTLTLTAVSFTNAGNYSVVVTNNYGSVTSHVAGLTVIALPSFTAQPTNLTILSGDNAGFSATASGTAPLSYQWQKNGTNLANGGNLSGATTNVLTLTAVTTANAGNYTLIAANLYGTATSSVAALGVVQPPAFTLSLTNQTIQCGSNAIFNVAVVGTAPLSYQWSLDGTVLGVTASTNFVLKEIGPPDHTVTVTVTNLYGNAANSVTLTVVDTLPPVITLLGANPIYLPLDTDFVDPGATANDLCAGSVPVTATGTVNTNTLGTNVVTYTATDGNGNTNVVTRTVIVQPRAALMMLASSENPSGYRDNLAFTASVSPTNATGTIQFLTNGTAFDQEPLVSGMAASIGLSSLPRETNLITAVYSGDADDLPATNTLSQIVTNHPPVATSASYSILAGSPLDIPLTNLATNWSDPDGDTISLAAVSESTNGVTIMNDAGTLTYSDTNGVADEFFCTITDGWGGTNVQAVYIAIIPASEVPDITGVTSISDGSVTLTFSGAPGTNYVLEATTNLLSPDDWIPVTTNTPDTNGLWQFTDTSATNYPLRYYRLMLPQ